MPNARFIVLLVICVTVIVVMVMLGIGYIVQQQTTEIAPPSVGNSFEFNYRYINVDGMVCIVFYTERQLLYGVTCHWESYNPERLFEP